MLHDPQAEVLVVLAAQARVDVDRLSLPGGGSAEVIEDEDGDQVVQVTGGRVRPDELVRAVVRSPGFSVRGRTLDLVVMTDGGWDRHVLGADLATRLLFARHDDEATAAGGRRVAVVVPPTDDALVAPTPSPVARSASSLAGRGSRGVGELLEVPVLADPTADPARLQAATLAGADLVVAAWGVLDGDAADALDDVLAALRTCRDDGVGVLVRTRDEELDVVGTDRHPAARPENRPGDGLAAAPSDWLWGAPLA